MVQALTDLIRMSGLVHLTYKEIIMIIIACIFLYLAIKKGYEPYLLIPIAFYSGWISVASGVFTTMLYVYLLRYDQLHATAMTLAANGLVWNAIGAVAHLTLGHIYWELAPGLVIGAVTGSYLGASLGIKKGNKFLKHIFLLSAVVSGLVLVYKAL